MSFQVMPFNDMSFDQSNFHSHSIERAVHLPEIGLMKYSEKLASQADLRGNPFKTENDTEKLLLIRQREREHNRLENEKSKLFSELCLGNQDRQNIARKKYLELKKDRAGVIRNVSEISHHKERAKSQTKQRKLWEEPVPKKINLFSDFQSFVELKKQESDLKRHPADQTKTPVKNSMTQIELAEQPLTSLSQFKTPSKTQRGRTERSNGSRLGNKYLTYMSNEPKETTVTKLDSQRQILRNNISIQHKEQELKQLKDLLQGESASIKKAKKEYEGDIEKFALYKDEIELQTARVKQNLNSIRKESHQMDAELVRLEKEIEQVGQEIKQVDGQVEIFKQHKEFIKGIGDEFVVDRNRKIQAARLSIVLRSSILKKLAQEKSSTFMTQVKPDKLHLLKKKLKKNQESSDSEIEEGQQFKQYENPMHLINKPQQEEIPFTKENLFSFMEELEYKNAFLVKMTEDEEGELDKIRKQKEGMFDGQEKEIGILNGVIKSLEKKYEAQCAKLKSAQTTKSQVQGSPQKKAFIAIVGSSDYQRMIKLLKDMHCKLFTNKNAKQAERLEQEEATGKLDIGMLLKQIEDRLLFLSEAFDYAKACYSKTSTLQLQFKEILHEVDVQKRNRKLIEVKNREEQEVKRRYQKNLERMMKSENVVVNTGRVEKLRSRKPNLVKFVRKVEPTEEELDYMRYFVNI